MWILTLLLAFSTNIQTADRFDQFFEDATMRLDYYHTGTAAQEYYSLDQVYLEDVPWSGSRTVLLDSSGLGEYLFRVRDLTSDQIIYSRSYCTIFQEWQTTQEAIDGVFRTMHETVRFPFPKNPVEVVIAARDKNSVFSDRFKTLVDPASRFINREKKKFPFQTKALVKNGDPSRKVDIAILADGYTASEMGQFRKAAQHSIDVLFQQPPFDRRKKDFNVWLVEAVSPESGIDDPRENKWRHNILGTSYNALDLPRYALSPANKEIRDIAGLVPYDFITILTHSSRYGGGGIYNWQAVSYTGKENSNPAWWSDYVFIHEFGHLFAGLGDEYYSSEVAYQDFYPRGVEPWEPNLTALLDPQALKWKDMVAADTPIPTPWTKDEYDSLSVTLHKAVAEKDKANLREKMNAILEADRIQVRVGCYEGAGYTRTGLYRPALDCIMFSKKVIDFCPVCQSAIEKMIDSCIR